MYLLYAHLCISAHVEASQVMCVVCNLKLFKSGKTNMFVCMYLFAFFTLRCTAVCVCVILVVGYIRYIYLYIYSLLCSTLNFVPPNTPLLVGSSIVDSMCKQYWEYHIPQTYMHTNDIWVGDVQCISNNVCNILLMVFSGGRSMPTTVQLGQHSFRCMSVSTYVKALLAMAGSTLMGAQGNGCPAKQFILRHWREENIIYRLIERLLLLAIFRTHQLSDTCSIKKFLHYLVSRHGTEVIRFSNYFREHIS